MIYDKTNTRGDKYQSGIEMCVLGHEWRDMGIGIWVVSIEI